MLSSLSSLSSYVHVSDSVGKCSEALCCAWFEKDRSFTRLPGCSALLVVRPCWGCANTSSKAAVYAAVASLLPKLTTSETQHDYMTADEYDTKGSGNIIAERNHHYNRSQSLEWRHVTSLPSPSNIGTFTYVKHIFRPGCGSCRFEWAGRAKCPWGPA